MTFNAAGKTSPPLPSEARKRRREWFVVLVLFALVFLSLRYQNKLFSLTTEIPFSDNILVLALINVNSPLRYDERMADALIEYARARQPVMVVSGLAADRWQDTKQKS